MVEELRSKIKIIQSFLFLKKVGISNILLVDFIFFGSSFAKSSSTVDKS